MEDEPTDPPREHVGASGAPLMTLTQLTSLGSGECSQLHTVKPIRPHPEYKGAAESH